MRRSVRLHPPRRLAYKNKISGQPFYTARKYMALSIFGFMTCKNAANARKNRLQILFQHLRKSHPHHDVAEIGRVQHVRFQVPIPPDERVPV